MTETPLDPRVVLGLEPDQLPRHIAIIMDGNGRWANQRGMARINGHVEGAGNVRSIITTCARLKLDVLTLYSFSAENWKRPKDEIDALMDLYVEYLIKERETIMAKRRRVFDLYDSILRPAAPDLGLQLPALAEGSECGYHMYFVLLPDRETRDMMLRKLRETGIHSTFHYVPLHSSDGGRRFASRRTECPVTDDISGRLIRLPFHNRLADGDVERTATTFLEILGAS